MLVPSRKLRNNFVHFWKRLERAKEIVHIRKDKVNNTINSKKFTLLNDYQARALRALGLLLADGAPTVGGGKTF